MSDVTEVPVIGSGKFWPPVKGELVGIARWIVLAWAVQTLALAAVGAWIALEMRAERARAALASARDHEDADQLHRDLIRK